MKDFREQSLSVKNQYDWESNPTLTHTVKKKDEQDQFSFFDYTRQTKFRMKRQKITNSNLKFQKNILYHRQTVKTRLYYHYHSQVSTALAETHKATYLLMSVKEELDENHHSNACTDIIRKPFMFLQR